MKRLSTLIILVFIASTINAQTTKQKLDSIVFQNYYDEAWTTSKSYLYTYDEQGIQTQEKYLISNEDGGMITWKQMDYEYDTNHHLSQYTLAAVDEYSYPEIREVYRENMDYNMDGLMAQKTISWKNPVTLKWEWDSKTNYEYDEYENLVFKVDSGRTACAIPEWVPHRKSEFTYNSNNDLFIQLESVYSWTDEQWHDHDKQEYHYNSNGVLIQEMTYTKFGVPDWLEERKTEYTYDELGNTTQEAFYSFSDAEDWLMDRKLEFSYDSFNNRTQYIRYLWNIDELVQSQKMDWTFNTNYDYGELVNPFFSENDEIGDDGFGMFGTYDDNFSNMLAGNNIFSWNSITETWTGYMRSSFHYSEIFLGVSNLSESIISIYPNPATNFIEFNIENKSQAMTFKLFDINGKLVICKEITSTSRISVSEFKSGLYLYQIMLDKEVLHGKVILQ